MKKLFIFPIIFVLFLLIVNATKYEETFSLGGIKTYYFEDLDLEIKLVQATNFNAVFSLNNHLVNEIRLNETRNLDDQIIITVDNIYKENGTTFVEASIEFLTGDLDLSFLEKPIAHAGASIGSEAEADVNEQSKRQFSLALEQEKVVVDLDTKIKLLNISNSSAVFLIKNDNGEETKEINDKSFVEVLGVQIQLIDVLDSKVRIVMIKSPNFANEEKDEVNFIERILYWFVSLFKM